MVLYCIVLYTDKLCITTYLIMYYIVFGWFWLWYVLVVTFLCTTLGCSSQRNVDFLKKNQSARRPSEHPPVMGGNVSKRLGGIKGCKYKTSS